jgi:hypothetical protein
MITAIVIVLFIVIGLALTSPHTGHDPMDYE